MKDGRRVRILAALRPYVGGALILLFWPAAWQHAGLLGTYAFFPLWLGWILVVDWLVSLRKGDSLLTRSPLRWAALFALSVPFWWGFEFYNNRILPEPNWVYVYDPAQMTLIPPIVWKSVCFSTVVPALLEALELVGTYVRVRPVGAARPPVRARNQIAIGALGLLFLALVLLQGRWFFGLIWLAPAALLDLLNYRLGHRSILATLAQGRADLLAVLCVAGPLCGWFWEMWNYLSMPKWFYQLPPVYGPHIFEMPLLGYLGYTAFAAEIYALAVLVLRPAVTAPAEVF